MSALNEGALGLLRLSVSLFVQETSLQLTVTGHLIDGSTIGLTSAARGTSYGSSDLSICNFGVIDGQIFAGADGACIITATNSGLSAQAVGTIQAFTPTVLSHIDLPGFANNVDITGDFGYVAAGPAGLHVVDVTDRTQPLLVTTLALSGNANDVKVKPPLAFVAGGESGVRIIDISTLNPVLMHTVDTPGEAIDLTVVNDTVYVADGTGGIQYLDDGPYPRPRGVPFYDSSPA